jgi:hypothetical protein
VLTELLAARTVVSDYWIVGGTAAGEGAIIAHSHNTTARVFRLGQGGEIGGGGVAGQPWYAVETNWEFWKAPGGPAYPHDPRRVDIMRTLNALGARRGATAPGICVRRLGCARATRATARAALRPAQGPRANGSVLGGWGGAQAALSQPQVLNSGTVFTAIWEAHSGEMRVALRNPQRHSLGIGIS